MSETRCINDTDGDGNCHACVRNPQALCRVPVTGEPEYLARIDRTLDEILREQEPLPTEALTYKDVQDVLQRVYDEPYRDSAGNLPSLEHKYPDPLIEHKLDTETRADAKARLFAEQYAAYVNRLADGLGLPPKEYARGPRSYVQSDGRPYDTHDWRHFLNRWGTGVSGRRVPEIRVGVWRSTVEEMRVEGVKEAEARRALRILNQ